MSVMKLTFWGAAGTVTGSMHLLESDGKRYLLDCGLFQGRRKDTDLKNRNLPFPGDSIDAVVLSHSHIDHSGNLPTLVKHGFAGPIYSTPATIDLCKSARPPGITASRTATVSCSRSTPPPMPSAPSRCSAPCLITSPSNCPPP